MTDRPKWTRLVCAKCACTVLKPDDVACPACRCELNQTAGIPPENGIVAVCQVVGGIHAVRGLYEYPAGVDDAIKHSDSAVLIRAKVVRESNKIEAAIDDPKTKMFFVVELWPIGGGEVTIIHRS